MKPVRVLVVDDSPLFAEAIALILGRDPLIQVVGHSVDGEQAIGMTRRLHPDVITMDLHMPVMGGLEAIGRIMTSIPTPILVLTADPGGDDGVMAMEALARGALEVVLKPSSWPAQHEGEELRRHVRMLATVPVVSRPNRGGSCTRGDLPVGQAAGGPGGRLVAVAASTGGPAALASVLADLPENFPYPIVVVQHLAKGFAPTLASWLGSCTRLRVRLACEGVKLSGGEVWIALDDAHAIVQARGRLSISGGNAVDGHRPSANVLFESAAAAYGADAIGVVLTGMGQDGARGLLKIRRASGITRVQDEASSAIYGMPRAALELGAATQSISLGALGAWLCSLATTKTSRPRTTPGTS